MSKVINAPIEYVYDWATDYREEDNSMWGSKHPRIILFKTRKKVVYAYYSGGSDGKPKLGVRVVTLNPSKRSWHLDYYGEEETETGEYTLTRLGRAKTRLDIVLKNKWKHGRGPSSADFEKHTYFVWVQYADALEKDYKSGKGATS